MTDPRISDHPYYQPCANSRPYCEQCGDRRDAHEREELRPSGPFAEPETRLVTDPRINEALDRLERECRILLDEKQHPFMRHSAGVVLAVDVPVLVAVLREVQRIHAPKESAGRLVCAGCQTHVTFTPWHCPTVRAFAPLAEIGDQTP